MTLDPATLISLGVRTRGAESAARALDAIARARCDEAGWVRPSHRMALAAAAGLERGAWRSAVEGLVRTELLEVEAAPCESQRPPAYRLTAKGRALAGPQPGNDPAAARVEPGSNPGGSTRVSSSSYSLPEKEQSPSRNPGSPSPIDRSNPAATRLRPGSRDGFIIAVLRAALAEAERWAGQEDTDDDEVPRLEVAVDVPPAPPFEPMAIRRGMRDPRRDPWPGDVIERSANLAWRVEAVEPGRVVFVALGTGEPARPCRLNVWRAALDRRPVLVVAAGAPPGYSAPEAPRPSRAARPEGDRWTDEQLPELAQALADLHARGGGKVPWQLSRRAEAGWVMRAYADTIWRMLRGPEKGRPLASPWGRYVKTLGLVVAGKGEWAGLEDAAALEDATEAFRLAREELAKREGRAARERELEDDNARRLEQLAAEPPPGADRDTKPQNTLLAEVEPGHFAKVGEAATLERQREAKRRKPPKRVDVGKVLEALRRRGAS